MGTSCPVHLIVEEKYHADTQQDRVSLGVTRSEVRGQRSSAHLNLADFRLSYICLPRILYRNEMLLGSTNIVQAPVYSYGIRDLVRFTVRMILGNPGPRKFIPLHRTRFLFPRSSFYPSVSFHLPW